MLYETASITLTGPEWAVALDSLKRASAHPDPRYSEVESGNLARVLAKFVDAGAQTAPATREILARKLDQR